MIQRKLYVSSATGSGTVRLREGNYVSQPIVLSAQRQPVVFPQLRPDEIPVQDVITIEGNSDGVMISSDRKLNRAAPPDTSLVKASKSHCALVLGR